MLHLNRVQYHYLHAFNHPKLAAKLAGMMRYCTLFKIVPKWGDKVIFIIISIVQDLLDHVFRSYHLVNFHSRKKYKTEYRKKFRPFSAYQYVDGQWIKCRGGDGGYAPGHPVYHVEAYPGSAATGPAMASATQVHAVDGVAGAGGASVADSEAGAKPWYAEVTELKKKASEYKVSK